MSDIDTAELKRLAEGATPGPWEVHGDTSDYVVSRAPVSHCGDGNVICAEPDLIMEASREHWPANAAFIAAANPTVVLSLLTKLEAAERLVEALEPFVGLTELPERWSDDSVLARGDYEKLKVGHFRALSAALAKAKGEKT
jgi:hypothetical protein